MAIECPLEYCYGNPALLMAAMCSPQMCPHGDIPPVFDKLGTIQIRMEQYYQYGQGPEMSCVPCCVQGSNYGKIPSEYYYYY